MDTKDLFTEFCKIPFPDDSSENEKLAEILFELRMYNDYTAAAIEKYLSGMEINSSELDYDNTIENQLNDFISGEGNSEMDASIARQYLKYLLRIKEILKSIEK